MKSRILILFLLVAMYISSATVLAKTLDIPVTVSSDYRFLVASLGNAKPGSTYSWTVDGVVAKEGVVEETFFLAANGNLKPDKGPKPSSTKGVSYVSGHFGKAFIAPESGISFSVKDTIDLNKGTIEFWVSPRRNGDSSEYAKDRTFFSYRASNGDELVIWQASTGVICAAEWIDGVYMSAYSELGNMQSWKAKSWHHIVFTFSEEENFMRMYVDGKLAGNTNELHYRVPRKVASTFKLGNKQYAMDAVRFTREIYNSERVIAEYSRRSAPAVGETLFSLEDIRGGSNIKVQSGKALGTFRYAGLPLLNPQPDSTLLSAGTTKVDLQINTPVAAEVRWSLKADIPFEKMTPFSKGSGKKVHKTTIKGLSSNPATVNSVYLSSSKAVDYKLELKYRSVPSLKPDYPRISNLWSWRLTEDGYKDYLSKLQLAVPGTYDPEGLRRIRAVNPDIVLLATLQPLEYFNDEPPIPDDYFLKDVSGQRITLWPGTYRLNLTKPEVVAFNVHRLQETIKNSDMLFDGAFFDSFILDISGQKYDSYGNPIQIDADGDGVPDNPATLDATWREGLLEMVRLWRESMPGAYVTGHLSKGADELGNLFDGDNLGFLCVDIIDGRQTFGYAWDRYHGWTSDQSNPNITVIDTGAPNELGYGYGVYSNFQEPEQNIPSDVLEFTQTWYPTMRFGLAFALMGNGLYERHFSDVLYCEEWWYDEFDFRLGAPLGSAYNSPTADSDMSLPKPLFSEGNYESPSSYWQLAALPDADVKLSYDEGPASGQRAARIDINSLPSKAVPYDVIFFRELQVQKDVTYRLSFSAKSSAHRSILASLQHRGGDWENLGFWKEISLGQEWKKYETMFTATGDCTDAGLQFFLASTTGTVFIDDVCLEEMPLDVYRRDFENGIVLLNGTTERQTVSLGEGYTRIVGSQAPMWQYILDDDKDALYTGQWKSTHHDTPEWKPDPPFYHDWGSSCRESADSDAYADYDLTIPANGIYTFKVWLPDAPNRTKRTKSALYEIVAGGKVIASKKLDQTNSPDSWQTVATVTVKTKDKPQLRLRNEGSGILYADAVYVESKARYNDGSPTREVTLEPYDGIILKRIMD